MLEIETQKRSPAAVEFGLAREEEVPAIYDLYHDVYLNTYPNLEAGVSVKAVDRFLWYSRGIKYGRLEGAVADSDEEQRKLWVARQEDNIQGMISACNRTGEMWIEHFYVARQVQGQGIGSRLLQLVFRNLSTDGLTVPEVHLNMAPYLDETRAFYEAYGFAPVQPETPRFISEANPVPLIEMVRPPQPLNLLH